MFMPVPRVIWINGFYYSPINFFIPQNVKDKFTQYSVRVKKSIRVTVFTGRRFHLCSMVLFQWSGRRKQITENARQKNNCTTSFPKCEKCLIQKTALKQRRKSWSTLPAPMHRFTWTKKKTPFKPTAQLCSSGLPDALTFLCLSTFSLNLTSPVTQTTGKQKWQSIAQRMWLQ